MNYTWGRAISPNENSSGTSETSRRCLHGSQSGADQHRSTHNLGITNVWQFPSDRAALAERGGVLSRILGGWQINNMISIMSGVPFTVFADGTSLNLPGSDQTADQVKPACRSSAASGATTPYYDPTGVRGGDRRRDSATPATTFCAGRASSTGTSG